MTSFKCDECGQFMDASKGHVEEVWPDGSQPDAYLSCLCVVCFVGGKDEMKRLVAENIFDLKESANG